MGKFSYSKDRQRHCHVPNERELERRAVFHVSHFQGAAWLYMKYVMKFMPILAIHALVRIRLAFRLHSFATILKWLKY